MNKDAWTSPEVAHIIGVAPRMVTIWAERGYIAPSVLDANGRGTKRLWSSADIIRVAVVRDLYDILLPGKLKAAWVLGGLQPSHMFHLAEKWELVLGPIVLTINLNRIREDNKRRAWADHATG